MNARSVVRAYASYIGIHKGKIGGVGECGQHRGTNDLDFRAIIDPVPPANRRILTRHEPNTTQFPRACSILRPSVNFDRSSVKL